MNTNSPKIIDSLGNLDLLALPKTAFLCSRKIPASVILKCYDWAIRQRQSGNCVISGFHSTIEKDVFHYLISGTQPIIVVLARGMKDRIEPEIRSAISARRLLLISPFEKHIKRATAETAATRNRLMVDLANDVTIGFASREGMIDRLVDGVHEKPIHRLIGNYVNSR